MEYFFGASGSAAVGKRKLRCRIGSNLETLTIANVNDESDPVFVDSEYFTGYVAVRVKNFNGITPSGKAAISDLPYFENKRRVFSIQVTGRFKKEYTADDVVFGAEFEKKVAPPTGAWVAIKFANLIDPALKTDVYAEKPWLWSPVLCAMNIVNVAKAKKPFTASSKAVAKHRSEIKMEPHPDEVLCEWKGTEELTENTSLLMDDADDLPFPPEGIAERRRHFQSEEERKAVTFKPDNVYQTEIFAPFIDLNTFDLTLGININLLQYLNGQPIRMMSKSLSKGDPFYVVEFDLVNA
ncbi:hypothetical protein HDU85_003457 [Gaertneriomyces sp. JEL0708]|nr:hypothetical protein HDU85_003457 [Gaertneriomyces sp. JEL0708]